ncbi:phosphatase PAP2 family protein, partial [Aeromonas veronii]
SLALLLALTTGLARVWLGVHFISDVAVGLLIGALLLA